MRAGRGDGLAGVALVPDPDVAVVVVAAFARPLGQRRRRGGDHAAAGAGQPGEHGVGVPGVASGDRRPSSGTRSRHAASVADHASSGCGGSASSSSSGEDEHEVVVLARLEFELEREHLAAMAVALRPRVGRRPPSDAGLPTRPVQTPRRFAADRGRLVAEPAAQVETTARCVALAARSPAAG